MASNYIKHKIDQRQAGKDKTTIVPAIYFPSFSTRLSKQSKIVLKYIKFKQYNQLP